MPITFHILLIEDEPEKWVPFFNAIDTTQENNILQVDTITTLEKGKDSLLKNHSFLDAVLIEFNFPDISPGEVLKTLHWSRTLFPNLPVFILCGNPASEDIPTITAFIKAGAVNYFNITNFQPAYLSAHLWAARENNKTKQRYEAVTAAVSSDIQEKKPFLSKHVMEGSKLCGYFAYALEAVKKPRTREEESEFLDIAERWHREFFRMLTLIIDEQVTLNLIFSRNPKTAEDSLATVGVYWHFEISAPNSDELTREYERTVRDLNLYLGNTSLYPNNPYLFIPVTKAAQLEALIIPEGINQFRIRRKTVECPPITSEVGFGNSRTKVFNPVLSVFQKPEEWSSINIFCKIMAQEDQCTLLTITIKPTRLTQLEKNEATKWALSLPDNFPLVDKEIDIYRDFLEGLWHATFKPFLVTYHLFTHESVPNDALRAALFNAFQLDQFESDDPKVHDALFAGIYPDYSLPMYARMPLPQKEGVPGIVTIPRNMLYLPHNIHKDGVLMGQKMVSDRSNQIRIKYADLSQHAYIIGQTGTGKSTLLYTMVMDMLRSGKHVSLIDPHGDLYDQVVKNLPESCKSNTILFDPAGSEDMPGINFLQHDPNDSFQKSFLLNTMWVILDNLYDMKQTGGPIFTKYLQAAMRLVMEAQGSLLDVIRVFENKDYRNVLLGNTNDDELRSEWHEIVSTGGESSFANISVYITSKLNEFRNNLFIREILRAKENQLDFNDVLNNGRNLLVRLPIGTLGERGVNLIGQIIFNKFLMTAFAREKISVDQRLDHVLVVDEFHKFTTDALGKVFSEARKYHLSLVVANQTFSQLTDETQHILLGNVGSVLLFRPGINDAHIVARYFEPDFSTGELCNLPNYQCAARISINHRPSKPFVFETIKIE